MIYKKALEVQILHEVALRQVRQVAIEVEFKHKYFFSYGGY